jgi:hypothetical protein
MLRLVASQTVDLALLNRNMLPSQLQSNIDRECDKYGWKSQTGGSTMMSGLSGAGSKLGSAVSWGSTALGAFQLGRKVYNTFYG